MNFKRTHFAAKRGTSTYTGEDGSVIYLPKSRANHPEEFETCLEPQAKAARVSTAAPKLSKEERKAQRDAMTPEQKIQAARDKAKQAADRAEKLAAKLSAQA